MKPKINKETFSTPLAICIMYILASGLAIMVFRFIFPGESVPLAVFSRSWRLTQGFLEYLNLFPALILTSLVIPFAFKTYSNEKNQPFSLHLFEYFKASIVAAIFTSTLYGLLFTLALPLAKNHEVNLLHLGRLYHLAWENAQEFAAEGDWEEAAQLLAICEKIWPNSPETSRLRTEADINIESAKLYRANLPDTLTDNVTWPEAPRELSVTDAIAMAQTALNENRFFDAHWLATLGSRLAQPNSPELSTATRLAAIAWNGVNSITPSEGEVRAFNNFRLKREGYEAMLGGEWISAYFLFHELLELSPDDPDAIRYFALSEEGVKGVAFFVDELELSLGHILSGAIFSLPLPEEPDQHVPQGRLVIRASSLSTALDYAYGIDSEMMAFDRNGQLLWSMTVPYIKFLPVSLDSESAVTVFLRALDRYNQNVHWYPEITVFGQVVPGNSEITLPISWDSFLLLSNVRRGLSILSTSELRGAADNLGNCGHLPAIFETELLARFARPLFLLPFSIFIIGFGWQYRAMKRPRYMGLPMLVILPVVFSAAIHFSRSLLNNIAVMTIVTFGFATATIFFGIGIVILLVLSLIVLSSRYS